MAYKNTDDRKAASRRHYDANKQNYLERNTRYRVEIKEFTKILKEAAPCKDCGTTYPYYVMDFDHLDAGLKLNNINYLSFTGRIGALKEKY